MQQSNILRIVVASPGDVQAERDALDGVVEELNRGIAAQSNVRFELIRWETDAYPGFHAGGAQLQIDDALRIEQCDLLIGIFWKRFGTPVRDANSGTEHEFRLAYQFWRRTGRPWIMMYFNQKPYALRTKAEAEQLIRVLEFREKLQGEGLYWEYKGKEDFVKRVRNHLT